jgi:hypothetical protein
MKEINWDDFTSEIFTIAGIVRQKNADKLFLSLLKQIEKSGINCKKTFTIGEIADIIPIGTAGVNINATYNFSFMSMLSGQGDRNYFIFEKAYIKDKLTEVCNTRNRDNNYWKKNHLSDRVKINPQYIKAI